MPDSQRRADDLYGLPPGEFVAARDALVRQLRAAGEREQAAQVKALRRPSAVAAALNATARSHPDLLDAALRAADQLREATQAAVAGDASDLRSATAAERAATKRFLDIAEGHLAAGPGDAHQRLAATLRAASLDAEVGDALRRGVLAADHEASGFDFAAGFELGDVPEPPTPPTTAGRTRAGSRTGRRSSEQVRDPGEDEAAERRRTLEAWVTELRGLAAERAAAADAAEAAARIARAAAERAQEDLDAAEAELESTQRDAPGAARKRPRARSRGPQEGP